MNGAGGAGEAEGAGERHCLALTRVENNFKEHN